MEDMDREIMVDFFDESIEGLEKVSSLLVDFETNQDDLGLINSIFRPVHSLKGNSAFFGLMNVKKLAHELETILDMLRKRQTSVTPAIMAGMFEGVDMLRATMERLRDGGAEVEDADAFKSLVAKVKDLAKATVSDKADVWARMIETLDRIAIRLGKDDKHFVSELESVLSDLKTLAPVPAKLAPSGEPDALKRLLVLLAPDAGPEAGSGAASEEALACLNTLRQAAPSESLAAELDEAIRVHGVFTGSAVGFDDLCRETLRAAVTKIKEQWPADATRGAADAMRETEAKPSADSVTKEASVSSSPKADAHKTMRVSEENIDKFLEYVGELLVVGDMFHHIERSLATSDADRNLANRLRTVNETFTVLSDNLRRSIMSIRKVSVKPLLQKAPRIARDVAKAAGKDIAVETAGEDVDIDKSLVDMLDTPLTHMIRNAADHGIETPDERRAAGKDPRGTIRLSIAEDDRFVVMTVADDGRGLNEDAIRRKAEGLGMIRPDQVMTQADVVNLLFAPGVSTAKAVTDVSGRGVGMDVVKRAIESAGGAILCESEAGKGSVFTVRVPRTVATEIMQGFLVKDDGATYVLPMEHIQETVSAEPGDIKTVEERGLCIARHGRLYSVCRLGAAFEGRSVAWEHRDRYTLVMIETQGALRAMAVDQVIGIQQVVVRNVEGEIGKPDFVSGGAVMGDGQVAMVVDVVKLFQKS